jgi:NitT/TauT family transport system substrate-binding protein
MLHQFDIVKSSVTADDAKSWFTNEYIDAITKDGETVWPAP